MKITAVDFIFSLAADGFITPKIMYQLYRPHPWHGLTVGEDAPEIVQAYIEITPFDMIKYEVDKQSGYLKVDRPQLTSSLPPTLYGFIPQTYCGDEIAALAGTPKGDGDPLDICVISERPITKSEILLNGRVIGGLQLVDNNEADDKIIAVLANDGMWGEVNELADLPKILVDRLVHYFSTYKLIPGKEIKVSVDKIYDRTEAYAVIGAARRDYEAKFGRTLD